MIIVTDRDETTANLKELYNMLIQYNNMIKYVRTKVKMLLKILKVQIKNFCQKFDILHTIKKISDTDTISRFYVRKLSNNHKLTQI